MKVILARTPRGKCGYCPLQVLPNQRYVKLYRPATKEEREDPNVKKTMRPRRGPEIEYAVHEGCFQSEADRKREEARQQREERENGMKAKEHIAHTTTGTVNAIEGADRIDSTTVLACMAEEVYACNVANGWFDEGRTFGDDIALLHSEVSEMLEAYRDGMMAGFSWKAGPKTKIIAGTDLATATNADFVAAGYVMKPEGVRSEAADVLVRLLDTCKRYDIDLFAAWREKLDYNWTRGYKHGGKVL